MIDVRDGSYVNDIKWKIRWNEEWLWDIAVYPRGSVSTALEGTDEFRFDSLLTKQNSFIFRLDGIGRVAG